MLNTNDVIIFGAGPSGATLARKLSEEGKKVLVLETKDVVSGNLYDYKNELGIFVHKYGPHIFQTSNPEIIEFVKKFSDWKEFRHKVNVLIENKEVPLPINFKSLDLLFPEKTEILKQKLKDKFSDDVIYILDLLNVDDEDLKELGHFVYKNVFENYTIKMWGIKASDIDQSVLKRVPVRLSYDDGYFSDKFQAVPTNGYTEFIKELLNHKNITLKLNIPKDYLSIKNKKTFINGVEINKPIIWTGPVDYLFRYSKGELPYRSLKFEFENIDIDSFQKRPVVNYPAHPKMTRITEYKKLSQQEHESLLRDKTTIGREYPGEYSKNSKNFPDPYYPVIKKDGINPAEAYFKEAKEINNLYLLGRLAEYKYKQMAQAIGDALKLNIRL